MASRLGIDKMAPRGEGQSKDSWSAEVLACRSGFAMSIQSRELTRAFPTLSPGYWPLDALLSWHEHAVRARDDENHPAHAHPLGHTILGRVVTSELSLRGVRTDELAHLRIDAPPTWPRVSTPVLTEEWQKIASEGGGRIPPAKRVTDLWAQHKYSLMARDPNRGREIGAALGAQDPTLTIETLLPELVTMLRTPPGEGTLRDAVMHMWGYVVPTARARGLTADFANVPTTVARIAEIALEDPASYLANSTALTDLAVWGNGTS